MKNLSLLIIRLINVIFNNRKPAVPVPPSTVTVKVTLIEKPKEKKMTTPADTLVTQYPDRISQLQGPVFDYLKPGMPYSSDLQNLCMQVFYPAARNWPAAQQFSASVQKVNPGITCPADYVAMVEKAVGPTLSNEEEDALQDTANKLGVNRDNLYQLIAFESGWDPAATNPYSGARGLIQFMPSTAAGMGFAAEVAGSIAGIVALVVAVWYLLKKYGYI